MKKQYNFEFKGSGKKFARAILSNAPVSTKYSTELAREMKGKNAKWAQSLLEDIIEKKRFLPLRKYNLEFGHRKGNAVSGTKSGRYPQRLCKSWLKLLKSLKANADYKGLDADNLIIIHAFASTGFRKTSHQAQGKIGGKKRRKKSTHIEIVAREAA